MRAQRSNPESIRGKILDCFAALAMTRCEYEYYLPESSWLSPERRLGRARSPSSRSFPPTCRSINPKTASIDTPLNLDTLPRAPLGVVVRKHFEF
ncbi:hypothetical protein EI171_18820 [Bradyrhizobium sp. LCT2]|nr:hypothetical protein EI171_18820 [Bradyrhizobium sp. LCT2]